MNDIDREYIACIAFWIGMNVWATQLNLPFPTAFIAFIGFAIAIAYHLNKQRLRRKRK